MNTYFIYTSDEFCYPVVIYAEHYFRNKNSGYCNFYDFNGNMIIQFPLEQIVDICKVGDKDE